MYSSLGQALQRFKPIEFDVREYRHELEGLARHILRAVPSGEGPGEPGLLDMAPALGRLRGERTVRIWLHRIASTETRQLRRREKPGPIDIYLDAVVAGQKGHEIPDRDDLALDLEIRMVILESFSGLPDNYRRALLLKEGKGLSVEDVARLMGTTNASVRSVLYRARHALRERSGT